MTSNDTINAGKHVTSNIARARSQRYTRYSVFRLAELTLCYFSTLVRPNVISDGPDKRGVLRLITHEIDHPPPHDILYLLSFDSWHMSYAILRILAFANTLYMFILEYKNGIAVKKIKHATNQPWSMSIKRYFKTWNMTRWLVKCFVTFGRAIQSVE